MFFLRIDIEFCKRIIQSGLICLFFCLSSAWAQTANPPSEIPVRPGDTFSSIAARYTGNLASWRKLYDPHLSGLKNPNRLSAGMRLELVVDRSAGRYLRLVVPTRVSAEMANTARPAAATPALVANSASNQSPSGVQIASSSSVEAPLTIGVVPNISVAALQMQYEYLKRYLERTGNGQKVRIVVPATFKVFFDSTMHGDYDLAIAAANLARVAQVERNLHPLLSFEPRIAANLVSLIEGGIASPRDIQGKTLAFSNPQSLVAMYAQQWLSTNMRFEAGRDYEVKGARTDLGVGRMLLTGEAAAAIMSQGEFKALPPEESSRMKVVEVFARVPNFIVLAHPRLGRDQVSHLRTHLKDFLADATDGAAFARISGLTGIVDVDPATLHELDPFVSVTRKAMGY
mgnify:CR=1 FL=1